MASLTVNLSREVLKALVASRSMTIAVESGGGGSPVPRTALTPRRRGSRRGGTRGRGKAAGPRAGSLTAKLAAWASDRKRPFGADDVMKALKVKRGHAGMLLTGAVRTGALRREGRGEYVAFF